MRRAARKDAGQADIVSGLLAVGCSVLPLDVKDGPDLVVGRLGVNYLLEVKKPPGPRGGRSGHSRSLRPGQERFHASWRGQRSVVANVEEALAAVGITGG